MTVSQKISAGTVSFVIHCYLEKTTKKEIQASKLQEKQCDPAGVANSNSLNRTFINGL